MSKQHEVSKYKHLSRTVLALSRRIDMLHLLEPVNVIDEKIRFFSGKTHQPSFEYNPITYSPKRLERELAALNFPDDTFGKLLKRKAHEVWLSNQIVVHRADKTSIRSLSSQLYGIPSKELINKAISIAVAIKKQKKAEEPKIYSSRDVAMATRKTIAKLGLRSWEVLRTKRQSSSVNVVKKQIKISMQKSYSKTDIKGIIAHEVIGHVYRAINGYRQPFVIFATGLPGYLSTEEGLATYLEEKYDSLDKSSLLRHSLKVVAVDSILKNFCFSACFKRLLELGADEDMAWELSSRVFRGGGFLKDHLYLKGYFEIKQYIAKGGDIKKLYVGKIGLRDLKFCGDLRRRKMLVPPVRLPPPQLKDCP